MNTILDTVIYLSAFFHFWRPQIKFSHHPLVVHRHIRCAFFHFFCLFFCLSVESIICWVFNQIHKKMSSWFLLSVMLNIIFIWHGSKYAQSSWSIDWYCWQHEIVWIQLSFPLHFRFIFFIFFYFLFLFQRVFSFPFEEHWIYIQIVCNRNDITWHKFTYHKFFFFFSNTRNRTMLLALKLHMQLMCRSNTSTSTKLNNIYTKFEWNATGIDFFQKKKKSHGNIGVFLEFPHTFG